MIPPLFHRVRLFLLILGSGTLCLGPSVIGSPTGIVPSESDLFFAGTIPRLQIQMDAAAQDSLRKNPREYVPATVTEGATVYPQVAVHLKGSVGSFRPLDDMPALTLDFSRFENGRKFHGLRRIYLNNSVEDPSYTNDKIGSEFFQAAGAPAPRVTRSLVRLNGGAPRLYVLKEGFTEDFLERYFHHISGELYEPGTRHDVDEKLERNSVEFPFDRNRTALKKLAAATRETDPAQRWQKLEAALDTRQFLTFMAAEVILGHRDGYCINRNNFRVYHDLDSDKMIFFPHGMDQLLGTADLPWQPNWSGLVAQAVMSTPEGSQGYAAVFGALLTNQFKV
jgi:spore coat protein CotH